MISRSFVGLLFALATGGALFAPACLLPDYTVGGGSADNADGATPSTGDGATPSDGASSDGVAADGGRSCAPLTGNCDGVPSNGCETDLRTSPMHCGACGRACGGAQCQAGECQAERLVGNLAEPLGLELGGPRLVWYESQSIRGCRADDCSSSKAILADVNGPLLSQPTGSLTPRQIAVIGQSLFFSQCPSNSNNDCGIAMCDIAGCKLTGAAFVAPSNTNRRAQLVVAGAGSIFTHQGIDGLYRTDPAAKTVTYVGAAYKIGDQLQAFHLDAQRALWLDDNTSQANPTGGLFLCPPAGCPANPVRLLPPPVKHLSVDKNVAYTSAGTAAASSIVACDANGCGSAGTVLATNQPFVGDIAADGNAVYWSTIGAANTALNTAAVGAVLRCALPSCAGGPTKIADGVVNPTSVRVDPTYVYWLERGATGQSNGQIMRRRR